MGRDSPVEVENLSFQLQKVFMEVLELEKSFGFVIYSYLKQTMHLQQLKGSNRSKLAMWKGYHFVNEIEFLFEFYLNTKPVFTTGQF